MRRCWRQVRRAVWTVRKTLWFWLIVDQPTRWQTHWRKWGEYDLMIQQAERWERSHGEL